MRKVLVKLPELYYSIRELEVPEDASRDEVIKLARSMMDGQKDLEHVLEMDTYTPAIVQELPNKYEEDKPDIVTETNNKDKKLVQDEILGLLDDTIDSELGAMIPFYPIAVIAKEVLLDYAQSTLNLHPRNT